MTEDYNLCRLEAKGYKINAYNSNLNSQNNTNNEGIFFDLFVTIFTSEYSQTTVTKTEIGSYIRKLRTFFTNAINKKYGKIEESNPAFDLADTIYKNQGKYRRSQSVCSDGWYSQTRPNPR